MSLIELMVAISVASLMFLAMTNCLVNGAKALKVLQKRTEMTQQARLVLERMTREIATAFQPHGMSPETDPRTDRPWFKVRSFVSPATAGEELSFTGNFFQLQEFEPNPGKGDLTEVHYLITGTSPDRNLYRRQEENNLATLDADLWAGGLQQMFAQDVKDLQFKHWNKAGVEQGSNIDYAGAPAEASEWPSKILISVTFTDPDNIVDDMTFSTMVSVMRQI